MVAGSVLLFIMVPAISHLIWKLIPEKRLAIAVLNKTVPTEDFWEHQSFFWLLNHLKLVNAHGAYEAEKDYFGYKPKGNSTGTQEDFKGMSEHQIDSIASGLEFLYIIDTYGIYERDIDPLATSNKKVYGGLIQEDFQLIKTVLEKEKSLLVEFNTIASPTSKSLRTEFETLLGIQWTGWIARYFDELDIYINTDIPDWIFSNYIKQHGSWDFKGRGVIFIGEYGRIEVLVYPEMIGNKVPLVRSTVQSQSSFAIPSSVSYPHWIEINRISRDYEVISYYDLEPSEAGLNKLMKMGLPKYFPATVRRKNGEGYIYYFAGDFAGHSLIQPSHRYFGLPWLWKFFYGPEDYSRRDSFFWQYYYPLMKTILK